MQEKNLNIIIIGGEGNGTVITSTLIDMEMGNNIVGFLSDSNKQEIYDFQVLGNINKSNVQYFIEKDDSFKFVFALSTVKKTKERIEKFLSLGIPEDRFINIIHPTVNLSSSCKLGIGIVLMPHVVIGPNTIIGDFTQMYAQSFLGHNSSLGKFNFVANNASIGGSVFVGQGCHIGSNSSIREFVNINEYSTIGLGAVILNDTKPNSINVGNPGREL